MGRARVLVEVKDKNVKEQRIPYTTITQRTMPFTSAVNRFKTMGFAVVCEGGACNVVIFVKTIYEWRLLVRGRREFSQLLAVIE
jgi:hypothetical protein